MFRCDYASKKEVVNFVRPSTRPSVPCYFRMTYMADFEDKKSSNDIIINDTISADKEVASDAPERYLPFHWVGKKSMPCIVPICKFHIHDLLFENCL